MLLAWMYILWLHTFRWHTAEDVRVCFTLFTPSVRRMPDDALHGVDCRAPCLSLWRRRQYLQRALQLSRSERVKTYLFLKSCAPFRFFFLWYSHRKKTENRLPSCFFVFSFVACAGGGANSLTCLYQNQTPEACVPDPYWTNLRQWSQQLRTLMIWTHWGLVLSAHRLPARSPINSFLLKLFARQHKSILFCLGQGWPVWNMSDIFIYFFPHECVKWLADMHGEEKKHTGAVVWLYWNIHFSIDFHKRCICDYLIFSFLNRVELHIISSLVLRQN